MRTNHVKGDDEGDASPAPPQLLQPPRSCWARGAPGLTASPQVQPAGLQSSGSGSGSFLDHQRVCALPLLPLILVCALWNVS